MITKHRRAGGSTSLLRLLRQYLLGCGMLGILNGAFIAAAPATADDGLAQPLMIPVPERREPTQLEADTQGEIWFDSHSPFDFDLLISHFDAVPRTSTQGYLYLPDGASAERPAPAVVLLPGSGGVKLGRQMLHANALVARGYAVLVVDYYASRDVDDDIVPYALMVLNVTEFDVLADAYGALRAMHNHPAVDGQRIALMGFSYGGMATRMAMDVRLKDLLAPKQHPFAAHVDFYGPCFQDFQTETTTGAPLLTLRGAQDASNDLVQCTQREEALRAAGSEVSGVIYADAGHSWDNLHRRYTNTANYLRGCELVYDEWGYPSVNSTPMIDAEAPLTRAQRFQMRMRSGSYLTECIGTGYIVGRNQAVYEDSLVKYLDFLDRSLSNTP